MRKINLTHIPISPGGLRVAALRLQKGLNELIDEVNALEKRVAALEAPNRPGTRPKRPKARKEAETE